MLAEMAMAETKMGRLEHKVMKNEGAANLSPGVEDLCSDAVTGSNGLLLIEGTPYGVINSITPITNPTSTVINHGIIMIAAGNAIVYSPHPGAKECTQKTITLINEAIVEAGGPANLQTCVAEPSLRTAKQIMEHPKIPMVVATGGGSVVRAAMSTGKKAIAAGPGNPPVIVDETADIPKAGRDIIAGSSFDNNILCIGEKTIFVLEEVANNLMDELEKNGGQFLSNVELKKIEELVIQDGGMNKDCIGKDASVILEDAGIRPKDGVLMILMQTPADHIFVTEEFLMPILPIVRVKTFDGAVELAVKTESGYGHTAIIHSKNIDNITKYAKAIGTTVFVVNAPSYACEGLEGEGFLAMTIAGPTGEGFTRPRHFTRERRTTFASSASVYSL
jgi:propionaldehyde dehydrogenase